MAYMQPLCRKPDQSPPSLDVPLSVGGSVCLYTTSTHMADGLQKARSRGSDAVVPLQSLGRAQTTD